MEGPLGVPDAVGAMAGIRLTPEVAGMWPGGCEQVGRAGEALPGPTLIPDPEGRGEASAQVSGSATGPSMVPCQGRWKWGWAQGVCPPETPRETYKLSQDWGGERGPISSSQGLVSDRLGWGRLGLRPGARPVPLATHQRVAAPAPWWPCLLSLLTGLPDTGAGWGGMEACPARGAP